ncbi:MAG: glycoside hydrolase family 43 protein [Sphingomicrobium sp.]
MRFHGLLTLALAISAAASTAAPTQSAAVFDWFEYRGADPLPQPRAGEYANPILGGFYPDPSIVRVGGDFYMVNSTFSWFPGIPVFHSRDLVNWRQIGNAIDRPDQLDFKKLGISRGVFAPTIAHHAGTFYIVNTCVDCGGNFVITARNPAGPWSDPTFLPQVGGIDPSLFFDADRRTWILNNDNPQGKPLYDGHRAIWIQQFDPKSKTSFGPRKMLIDGGVDIAKKPVWIEGPHLYQHNGFYYLMAAEGGTSDQHSEVIFRSRDVLGPYVPWDANPILTQRDLPEARRSPITSTGHADIVQLADGAWWSVFLGTRPYEGDYYNTGRETFMLPVKWENGWPRITSTGQPIPYNHKKPALLQTSGKPIYSRTMVARDEFTGKAIGPEWMMMRNPRERWHRLSGGALELKPRPVGLGDFGNPSFLARRQQHMYATASTSVRFTPRSDSDRAGLAAIQNDEYWFALSVARGRVVLERRAGPKDAARGVIIASAPLSDAAGAPVYLRIKARGAFYDFAYAQKPGAWRTLRQGEDGRILSTKTAGGFVGTLIGPYAYTDAQ